MELKNVEDLNNLLNGIIEFTESETKVINSGNLTGETMDRLIYNALVNSDGEVKNNASKAIKAVACSLGIFPASIQGLYEAIGRGDVSGFTVPAINIRGLTYDVARSIFRAAIDDDVGPVIFEIARSELGYTEQSPEEYSLNIIAAAVREGYVGPLFIQGDHFQLKAKAFREDRDKEIESLKVLIKEAIDAGFYNIDIDSSTLVDLEKDNVVEQQRDNFEVAACLTDYIRGLEPEGVTVSVGAEIGEVGGKNSTVGELRVFMDNYNKALEGYGSGLKGISKMSVQTGTSHGGVVLADGTVAEVKLDFEVLESISKACREDYDLAGAVQHGASTLPDDAFDMFPAKGTAEVHLATGFQNLIFDSSNFPDELREEIYNYLKANFSDEKKEGETDEQFIYKTRKKGFGPFKKRLLDLPESVRGELRRELQERFAFFFDKLRVSNTRSTVDRWINVVKV
ncbi:MAG: class II fructose-bisphosphate aldolase [Thermodesulfobacteriota bacterium]